MTEAEARRGRATSTAQSTHTAGRGVVSITGAKLYFIVTGYAIQLLLPRFLGSPEAFGLFSSAMNVVSILNNLLIAATVQTVSKHVSEDLEHGDSALRQGLLLQLGLGGFLGLGLFVLAPYLAGHVLLDPLLAPLLEVSAIVVFCYAIYAALIGALNGRQRFAQQATLDLTYTTLRTLGMLGAAALGFGALGAMVGFAAAVVSVLLLALLIVGTGTRRRQIPWRRWLFFMAPLWIYQLCLQLTLQVDLSVLKGGIAALGRDAGMLADVAAQTASRMAGFYRAAQTFAFVPYQLILPVTFVVFPMMSQAVSAGDHEASQRYIRAAMRFSSIVLLAIAAPVSGAAHGVMRIAYPEAYLAGSDALAILSLGMVCFALFVIGATVMSGAGRPALPAAIAAVTVVLCVSCDLLLLRIAGIGKHTLVAAATGTTLGMGFALVAIGVAIHMRFGAFIAAKSALRTLGAAGIAWSVARIVPSHSALGALGALVAGGLSFFAALLLLGELARADFDVLRRIARRN